MKVKTVKIGDKDHPCHVSATISTNYLSELQEISKSDAPTFSDLTYLVLASYRLAIIAGYYKKGFLYKLLRNWLSPSIEEMGILVGLEQIEEMRAALSNMTVEDLRNAEKKAVENIKKKPIKERLKTGGRN